MTGEEGRSEREQRREERRTERDARREERRAEREARRAERHRFRAEMHAHIGDAIRDRIRAEVHEGLQKRKWYFGFGDVGLGTPGETAEASEVVEKRFEIAGMPRLRVSNVSGETEISAGIPGEVLVRARKRVRGWSEDRAKRLLENVDVRMEQSGDEVVVEPRLFQQERGWLDLFRGGRVKVDLEIRVPREAHVEATTVSGELSVTGTRGQHELRSVSGDVSIDDVQGPLHVRSVSGDINATAFSGRVEVNSTSGEVEFSRSRVRTPDVVAVSGDVALESVLLASDAPEARVKTVSGDVELVMADPDAEIGYSSLSGDAVVEIAARIEKLGKRDRRIVIGSGGPRLRVKTVSGDLKVRRAADDEVVAEEHAAAEAMPMPPPEAPPPPAPPGAAAREILERVARGELSVDDAAARLDEVPPPPPPPAPDRGPDVPTRGRVLRIRVSEHGKQKVNVAIPLAIARIGKMKLGASGLVRGHLQKFGLDLDELLREVETAGRIVDINDDEDRVEIFVE